MRKVDSTVIYDRGIEFIALNDEPECVDAKEIRGYISVITLAECLRVPASRIARDVVKFRKRHHEYL